MEYMFLPFKKFADFDGRSRRKEYWMFFLFNILVGMFLGVIEGILGIGGESSILATIYQLAVLIPSIAVSIRRMHDVGKSGWYILIPIYNIILALTPGEKGQNIYGPDPKGEVDETDQIGKSDFV